MIIDDKASSKAFLTIKNSETESDGEYRFNSEKYDQKRKLKRNGFKMTDKYGMPVIKKENISMDEIDLIRFDKTKNEDSVNTYKTIHFFTYDWLFDNIYYNAENSVSKLKQYYALLTPDFSTYPSMPLVLQMYSTFKNRWCGAFWQSLGLKVIPTIEWGDERSFDFCFDGVEIGSTVAVATYYRTDKEGFILGYNKMLEVIKPSAIICYGQVFPEMKGKIKEVLPYDKEELIAKMGRDEYTKKLLDGSLYPTR